MMVSGLLRCPNLDFPRNQMVGGADRGKRFSVTSRIRICPALTGCLLFIFVRSPASYVHSSGLRFVVGQFWFDKSRSVQFATLFVRLVTLAITSRIILHPASAVSWFARAVRTGTSLKHLA